MPGGISRLVVVTRKTPYELLLERHGTYGQARFYLSTRGGEIAWHEAVHARLQAGLAIVLAAVPPDVRVVRVDRDDLDRFLFAPDDVVAMVGQDGLVPNVAKYLENQLAIGINPDPANYDGVLCRFPPELTGTLLKWVASRHGASFAVSELTMAVARREDGQTLYALNEIFVGHTTHQSARYRLTVGTDTERHSSSGLLCATGTGSTGWARSVALQRGIVAPLPAPAEPSLAWFVREPFPSITTGTDLSFGRLGVDEALVITSEMGEGGTIFADGIEQDRVEFADGQTVRLGIAERRLRLVVPAGV